MNLSSYSVHIQRVHGEVVGVLGQVVEDFLECDLLIALLQDDTICLSLVCGLYKFQQMFLVHASGSVYMCIHLCYTESIQ